VEQDLILKYYLGEIVHPNGKTIYEILKGQDGSRIGRTAGVIQWLFPLDTPSRHVPSAPVLSKSEIQEFKTDPKLREFYIVVLNRFLELYGIAIHGTSASIADDISTKDKWIYPSYHRFMPITRILRSLKLLEFRDEFETLKKILLICNARLGNKLDKTTLDIWFRI
jgi:hypothetical protein